MRDMVAAASTQPSPKPAGKKRVHSNTTATSMPFSMAQLRSSLSQAMPSRLVAVSERENSPIKYTYKIQDTQNK